MIVQGGALWCVLMFILAIIPRWLVSLNPYSGYHDPPRFGDYEAQRHWMEITVNLPISEWYRNSSANDLSYWGIDYPPLSAYLAYLFGKMSEVIEPELVALGSSRGYETLSSKVSSSVCASPRQLLMRLSVVLCDTVFYLSACYYMAFFVCAKESPTQRIFRFLMLSLSPSLIIIDHGHFQYNSVSLGLILWAVNGFLSDHDLLASTAFCLAILFKHISFYYAPAVLFFLLAKYLFRGTMDSYFPALSPKRDLRMILLLAATVLLTISVVFLPFCLHPSDCPSQVLTIVQRLFPWNRGLYEDKVANVWCSTLNPIIKLRERFSISILKTLSTGATLLALLPFVLLLISRPATPSSLLTALFGSSLSFYLFGFQVHEKSILFAVLADLLRYPPHLFFQVSALVSLVPLLLRDGQLVSLVGLSIGYAALLAFVRYRLTPLDRLSLLGWGLLLLLQAVVPPPEHLPHLHIVLQFAFACANFLAAYGLSLSELLSGRSKQKTR